MGRIDINGAINRNGVATVTRRRSLNCNGHWRSCLEKANRRIRSLRRMVGIESEIIQRSPTQRVRVLVLRKGLRAPAYSAGSLIRSPGSVAKSCISRGSIICNSRMIKWRMKPEIAYRDSASQRQTEGLDPTIKILIIDRVFIMPNPGRRIRHFVGNEGTAIDS